MSVHVKQFLTETHNVGVSGSMLLRKQVSPGFISSRRRASIFCLARSVHLALDEILVITVVAPVSIKAAMTQYKVFLFMLIYFYGAAVVFLDVGDGEETDLSADPVALATGVVGTEHLVFLSVKAV